MAQAIPIQPMPAFNRDVELRASLAAKWENWLSDFEMFLIASGITDKSRQRALSYCIKLVHGYVKSSNRFLKQGMLAII